MRKKNKETNIEKFLTSKSRDDDDIDMPQLTVNFKEGELWVSKDVFEILAPKKEKENAVSLMLNFVI